MIHCKEFSNFFFLNKTNGTFNVPLKTTQLILTLEYECRVILLSHICIITSHSHTEEDFDAQLGTSNNQIIHVGKISLDKKP